MGKVDKFRENAPNLPPDRTPERSDDRRIRGHRLSVSIPVVVRYRGKVIQGYVEALNISWSGMLLATNFPLSAADRLALEFTLPNSETPISVLAKVVRIQDGLIPEHATLIGVLFEEVEPNVQRMISGFVLEHLPMP